MLSETRMDKMDRENSCEGMQLFAPKTQQFNLIFSGSPVPAGLAKVMLDKLPWKSAAVGLSCSLPPLQTLLPSPDQLPPNALYRHLSSRSATGAVINGTGPDGCLPELDMSPCCKSCVYGICAFVLRCFFSVLTLYSPMEHSLGVTFFFSPLSPHVMLYFSSIPCLPVLSTPSYVCCVCMDRLMANFAGTCD